MNNLLCGNLKSAYEISYSSTRIIMFSDDGDSIAPFQFGLVHMFSSVKCRRYEIKD